MNNVKLAEDVKKEKIERCETGDCHFSTLLISSQLRFDEDPSHLQG